MRAIYCVLTLFCASIAVSANAFVLSFDTTATGLAELGPDAGSTTTCLAPDFCSLSLTFSDIDGSGISATVFAFLNQPPNTFPMSVWYDVGAADIGGIGAASVDQADAGSPGYDPDAAPAIGLLEIVTVTFSQDVIVDAFWMNGSDSLLNGVGGIFGADGGFPLEIVDCVDSLCDSLSWTGSTFSFSVAPDSPGYLAGVSFAPVPVPTALALFLPAALGLLGIGRFRQA